MALVGVDPTAGCALPQCVAWSLPPRTPSEIQSRGRRALSYRADVLVSCNWNPPLGSPKGGTKVHVPCGSEAGGPRAQGHWRTHPLQQGGEDSVREPPTAAAERKRKSLLRPMLRRSPLTSNADALDAVPTSVERDDPPSDTFPLRR